MNIALIGYGKMGKAIEKIAIDRGHNITLRITSSNKHEMTAERLKGTDVAIEFTRPESGKENVLTLLNAGVSVVCGTTGWNEGLQIAEETAKKNNVAFLQASNFSIGVNIFFEVNKMLASLMNNHPEYRISIDETHHTQKKDAPSGTAITLAEQIIAHTANKAAWALDDANIPGAIPIYVHRVEDVPGTHTITYSSRIDDIAVTHTAHNRDGFALGAVLAAEFVSGKEGTYQMKDVLKIK